MCVLKYEQGGRTHTVWINLKLNLIYNFIEECALVLNKDNLSRCCSDGQKFKECVFLDELKPNL